MRENGEEMNKEERRYEKEESLIKDIRKEDRATKTAKKGRKNSFVYAWKRKMRE